jgi:hypothetical protein
VRSFREEYGLRIFENRVLRKVFAPKGKGFRGMEEIAH